HRVRLAFLQRPVQLGGRWSIRQLLEGLVGILLAGKDFQKAGPTIQGVVEAVPALLEEGVARHLAGEQRAGLLQLGLDERVAGLPDERPAAVLLAPRREQ